MPQVGVLLIVKHLTEKNPWIPFPSVPFYSSLLYSTRTLHSYHTYCTVQQSNTLRLIDSFSLFAMNATTHSPLLALTQFTSMQSNPLQSIQFHSNSLIHLNLFNALFFLCIDLRARDTTDCQIYSILETTLRVLYGVWMDLFALVPNPHSSTSQSGIPLL